MVIRWAELNLAELLALVELHDLPLDPPAVAGRKLLVLWLQDPVQSWSPQAYQEALALERACDQLYIPVINRVEHLTNAGKSEGARLIAMAGLRAPRCARIEDAVAFRKTLLGLKPPLFVREDWGHGPPMLRADTEDEARALPIESLARPVAIEIVDVRDGQGRYRKFRYVAAGDAGVSHHLQVTAGWISRGEGRIDDDRAHKDEFDYLRGPDPHHARFQAARRFMKLDFVSFDYGCDAQGDAVVWEANPYPHIRFSKLNKYRNRALHRTVAAMWKLYLVRAKLPVPEKLELALAYD